LIIKGGFFISHPQYLFKPSFTKVTDGEASHRSLPAQAGTGRPTTFGVSNTNDLISNIWYILVMRFILRSKIHRAKVTEANLDYVGSIAIDEDLLDKSGLIEGEKVLVTSVTSGARLETYVISGEKGSGVICMNGPASHLIKEEEIVIIMGFELTDEPIKPRIILVDENNHFIKYI
jgi:aspartate 1-decarboxylase